MGKVHEGDMEVHLAEETVPGASDATEREAPRVLLALAAALERLVGRNERCLKDISEHRKMTIYHGLRPPNISVLKYLERMHKYSNCSPSCFVVGFVYIDHLLHKQPDVPIISLNVHRLLITSVMVATKLLDDVHYNNAFYARVGGISNAELNALEIDFLFRLDFRLQVTSNMFEGYCSHLEKEMMLAGQRLEKPLSKAVDIASEEIAQEKQRLSEDIQRKLRLVMNHSAVTYANSRNLQSLVSPPSSSLAS
ncbi:hypothetical protein KP509_36G016500 [Ceratopteris richardii]|uniref:Cyclin n=1 Tax=Ceratopteris richardii TaxID=49495 RepID=A0A8T2QA09_CERRI|nr:hypothetical protein KP509_36G016500 [Ceratopteris richardii]